MKPIRLLTVVSDIHSGSTVGLMPPKYTTLQGFTVQASPYQRWLWECWQDAMGFVRDIRGNDPMASIMNGDALEGSHHGSKQIVSADVGDHKGIAIKCLQPLADMSDAFYLTEGTECHVNNSEVSIAHALRAQLNPDFPRRKGEDEPPEGAYIFPRLSLNINGVQIVARHHMPTTIRRGLGGTPLSNTLADEQLEAANNDEPIPKVLLLAHSHKTRHYGDDEGLVCVTGAWQGLTRFGHKIVSAARCKPSIYVLDWRGKKPGEMPLVHFRRYRPPAQTTIKL